MKNSKLLKTLLIPTLGISAIGMVATISTSCRCALEPTPVDSVTLDKENLELVIGEDVKFVAAVLPEDATNKSVTWTSDHPEIASVDENGNVKAKTEGHATITVTSVDNPNAKYDCDVRVLSDSLDNCVSIFANEDSTLELKNIGGNNLYLTYWFNGMDDWNEYTQAITIDKGQTLYLKGSNPNGWATSESSYSILSVTGDVSLSGSVMSLLDDGTGTITTIPCNYCFYSLFASSDGISSVSKDFLPATTLTEYCYANMFRNCTSLLAAPNLHATTLGVGCCECMFINCTSLTTAPALPATTLANSCYSSMFYNCASLTTAPALPATSLAEACYLSIFESCSSLTTAPTLPATTLAENCYRYMFSHCSSLTAAPELPATTLADGCYYDMFNGCSSLETAPSLPATTLAEIAIVICLVIALV